MTQPTPFNMLKPLHVASPAAIFAWVALGLLMAVVGLAEALFASPIVPGLVFCVIIGLCLRGLSGSYPHAVLGSCNVVTLMRVALVAVITGALFAPVAPWTVFFLAVIAFATDGLDGWLARRAGLTSKFGARFDMEADALLAAVLSLVVLTYGTVGPVILVLGFARYLFVAAGWIFPALRGELAENYRRKTICVVQIAALIALVCPLTPPAYLSPIAGIAAVLLLYSFAVDVRALMRRGA